MSKKKKKEAQEVVGSEELLKPCGSSR